MLGHNTLDKVGNIDWERQYLGFPNWIGDIQETIKKQDHQKKLELEMAQIKHDAGNINQADLDSKAIASTCKQRFLQVHKS